MHERKECVYDDFLKSDYLPFKNKVVFTHKNYPKIKSSFYVKVLKVKHILIIYSHVMDIL